jgi:hypothetical protein
MHLPMVIGVVISGISYHADNNEKIAQTRITMRCCSSDCHEKEAECYSKCYDNFDQCIDFGNGFCEKEKSSCQSNCADRDRKCLDNCYGKNLCDYH